MTLAFHLRVDALARSDRVSLYYFVGILSSTISGLLIARITYPGAMVILGLTAAFLFMRFLRELRPDRMALPPELRVILRKPRSE